MTSASHRPMLYCYSADGTPIRLTGTFVSSFAGQSVQRRGGDGHELNIQRGYIVTRDGIGELTSAAIVRDLVPLRAGKGTWNFFSAAARFFPHLRELGAQSITITSTCFDRGLQSSMSRVMAQRQALYYQVKHGEKWLEGDGFREFLMDWTVSTGCSAHDAQNALKWGMVGVVADTAGALKGLYIGLESLRNGYSLLFSHLRTFLTSSLAFAGEDHPGVDELFTMWTDVGLDAEEAQELADLGILWKGGHVWVRADVHSQPNHIGRIHKAFLKTMQFRKFTESRWVTIGQCTRRLIASLLIGLPGLIELIKKNPQASDWYVHGYWDYVNPAVRRYAVVAGFASRPVDAALTEILTDDRLAGRKALLEEVMMEEWAWLTSIPEATWELIAAAVGPDEAAGELRHECYMSALSSSCFLHWRVIKRIGTLPWSLVEGDIGHNLDELLKLANAPGNDDTSDKIYTLLRLGLISKARVADALELLKEVPWSTAGVEQGHASAAILSRLHPMAGLDSVAQRSFCHTALPLLRSHGQETLRKKIASLEERLDRLRRKTGSGISGRQLYFQDLATGMATIRCNALLAQDMKVWSMRNHSVQWRALSEETKALYERRAADHRIEYKRFWAEKRIDLEETVKKLKVRLEFPVSEDGRLTLLSANRLSASDIAELDSALLHTDFIGQELLRKRQAAMMSPFPPPEAQQKMLNDTKVNLGLPDPQMSQWVKDLSYYRQWFRGTALIFNLGTAHESHMLFLFGLQSPMVVGLTRLQKVPSVLPLPSSVREGSLGANLTALDAYWPWQFDVKFNEPVWGWDITKEVTEVWVLRLLEFTAPGRLSSPASPVTFQDFVRDFPAPRQPRQAREAGSEAGGSASSGGSRAAASSSTVAAAPASTTSTTEPAEARYEELDDDELQALRDWLATKKETMRAERVVAQVHFEAACVGSQYTAKTHGVGSDVSRAYAVSKPAKQWAKHVIGNEMASFSLKLYTEDVAAALAVLWADRAEYWYLLHLAGELAETGPTMAQTLGAPLPDKVLEVLRDKPDNHPGYKRLPLVMAVGPR